MPSIRVALRGEEWLGPGRRASIAIDAAQIVPVPEGWVGPEETEMVELRRLQLARWAPARADPVRQPRGA
eukprot:1846391-Alexandrium_andersonii.AAC.1